MNFKKELKMVNNTLKLFGQASIEVTANGSDREKLEILLASYAERLKAANPQYKHFKNNRQIPEMIVQYLVTQIDKTK
jgi:hypothetical protein